MQAFRRLRFALLALAGLIPTLPAFATPGAIGGSWVTPDAAGPALSVGLTESGRRIDDGRFVIWPWTVNAEGEGRRFDSKAEAVDWVRKALAGGMRSIDVGCMQVNLRWHPDAFASLEAAFDPKANVAYALGYLGDLSKQYGPRLGIGRYHSATADYQDRYLAQIDHNLGFVEEMRRRVQATPLGIEPGGWGEVVLGGMAFTRGLVADAATQPLLPKGFAE